ncbi:MAG: glycosyltransferase family 4 protein [Gemmatimonadetes bacterium]|nr:glycosyltransferase family 4 protein [Gemmatimonadota bacterium]
MRVVVAGAHQSVVGGAETYQRDLISALRGRGHDVAHLCELRATTGSPPIDDGEAGIGQRWNVEELSETTALRLVERWRPDVVYVHGLRAPGLETSLLARHRCVLFAHSYYGTCATGFKRHAFPDVQMCSRRIGLGCLALHYPRRCGGLDPGGMLRDYRVQRRRFRLLHQYDAVLVASRHMFDEYLRHGVARARLHLAPLPPTGIVPDAAPPPVSVRTDRVMLVGRLTALKGGHYLIEAMHEASRTLGRSLILTVLGDGPERARLQEACVRHGLAAEFPGWVSSSRRNELLRSSDLLAVPSLWPEPFGLAGIEAQCVGLPAVAFAVGGIPDWLIDGVTGALAPGDPPTPAGLAAAMVRVLADWETHAALAQAAWERGRERSMQAHLRDLEPLLAPTASTAGTGQ